MVRTHVAEFLERRDGFPPADVECIYLINGASEGIKQVMKLAVQHDKRAGFLLPIPQYPLYTACIAENNADVVRERVGGGLSNSWLLQDRSGDCWIHGGRVGTIEPAEDRVRQGGHHRASREQG